MPDKNLIDTGTLQSQLGQPDLAVLDASWYLPSAGRDAHAEYLSGHIPGAVFFDIDIIADTTSGLPHMLPKPEPFARAMGALGLSDTMRYVVYDGAGLFSAARVWWTLRTYGVRDVRVLQGGLPKWRAEGRPLESGEVKRPLATFEPQLDHAAIADQQSVARVLQTGAAQVVDARSAERFRGDAPEPRAGVRSGHIPGSLNLPYTELIEDGILRPPDQIEAAFKRAGVDLQRPIVTSCGSGVTAAIVSLAAQSVGHAQLSLYDGSWSEWGSRDDLPTAKGNAERSVR